MPRVSAQRNIRDLNLPDNTSCYTIAEGVEYECKWSTEKCFIWRGVKYYTPSAWANAVKPGRKSAWWNIYIKRDDGRVLIADLCAPKEPAEPKPKKAKAEKPKAEPKPKKEPKPKAKPAREPEEFAEPESRDATHLPDPALDAEWADFKSRCERAGLWPTVAKVAERVRRLGTETENQMRRTIIARYTERLRGAEEYLEPV
jgi:hypothetical protein